MVDEAGVDDRLERKHAEWAIATARNVGKARRELQERVCFEIEQLLYEAKSQETRDALVTVARALLA